MDSIRWSEGNFGANDFVIDVNSRHRRPVTGAIWLPKDSCESNSVVLCGHGASGDRYQDPIPYLVNISLINTILLCCRSTAQFTV